MHDIRSGIWFITFHRKSNRKTLQFKNTKKAILFTKNDMIAVPQKIYSVKLSKFLTLRSKLKQLSNSLSTNH